MTRNPDKKATILIVDDRATNRRFLRTLLEYGPYTVIEAADGEAGLERAHEMKPDLIITDILMPKMDGFEFLRALRHESQFESTPVIVYTATYLEEEAGALAARSGAYCVLLRPAEPELILKVVEESLLSQPKFDSPEPDAEFEAKHRRILTDKLAAKVLELEAENILRREGEARLATALAASGQRVLDLDLSNYTVVLTSPNAGGDHTIELKGAFEEFTKSIHSDDVARVVQEIERSQAEGCDVFVKYRRLGPNEEEQIVEARGRFNRDSEGNAVRLVGSLVDVTAREETEKEIRMLAAMVENSLEFIGAATPEGIVTFVNRAGLEMIGADSPDDIVGKSFTVSIHPSNAGTALHAFSTTLEEGSWQGEIQLLNLKTSQAISCESTCISLKDPMGKVTQVSIIARDIRVSKGIQSELNARLAELTAMRRIDVAIAGAVNLKLILQIVMMEVMGFESIQSACVFIYIHELRYLEYACGSGLTENLEVRDLANSVILAREYLRADYEGGTTMEAIPLVAKGVVKGVLVTVRRIQEESDASVRQFMDAIASQAAIAIDSAVLFEELQHSKNELIQAYDETIEGWARALDLRDKETEGHSRRVTDLTVMVAREMRLPPDSLQHIRRGALLHDIGKVGVPDAILLKPGPLTPEERAVMEKHADYAVDLLSPIAYLQPAMDIPQHHHERWDGSGYPHGLKGAQIPLAARIFSIVDVWDALRSDRPYRNAWPHERVRDYIKDGAGTMFDPAVVSAFLRVVDSMLETSSDAG